VRALFLLTFISIGGVNWSELDYGRLYRIAAHFPGTAAIRVFDHIGQRRLSPSGVLYKYDFGNGENLRIYGRKKPPTYQLEKVSNRYIVVFSGESDILADPTDVELLIALLNGEFVEVIKVLIIDPLCSATVRQNRHLLQS